MFIIEMFDDSNNFYFFLTNHVRMDIEESLLHKKLIPPIIYILYIRKLKINIKIITYYFYTASAT